MGETITYGANIPNGALGTNRGENKFSWNGGSAWVIYPFLNALFCSHVYGRSNTVQPHSIRYMTLIRT